MEPEIIEEAIAFLASVEPEIEPDGVALNAVHMLSGNTEEQDSAETAAVS